MFDDLSKPHLPLVEVGRYQRLSQARERGLVVSAMELPHWIERDGDFFVLRVEEPAHHAVSIELEKFEAEHRQDEKHQRIDPPEKVGTLSLFIAAWLMSGFWLGQNLLPESWTDAGAAVSTKIVADGEWWRAITALTLHADLPHFAANLMTGLLFAAFVTAQRGSGLAWLSIVLSGTFGNLLNALFYAGEVHASIGASTAVFGALGLLVAGECVSRLRSPETRRLWHLVLPIGAGLGLLAYLGVGDEQKHTDYMAHLCGFVAGTALGGVLSVAQAGNRIGCAAQRLCGLVALCLPALAWWLAVHGRS